jgi:hypothetical protein
VSGIFIPVERNYDEIISEMLRQLDRHAEQLSMQSEQLSKQSEHQTRQSEKSEILWQEQRQINADLFAQIKDQNGVLNQNLEIALQTAGILDRIIKTNGLKL